MVKLIANRSMRYGTRRLMAGDVFEARHKDARVLVLLKRADKYVAPKRGRKPKQAEEPVAVVDPVVEPEVVAVETGVEPEGDAPEFPEAD